MTVPRFFLESILFFSPITQSNGFQVASPPIPVPKLLINRRQGALHQRPSRRFRKALPGHPRFPLITFQRRFPTGSGNAPRLDTVANPKSLEDLDNKNGPDGGPSRRSDRTMAREAHRVSSTGGGIGYARRKSETTKAITEHQELTHIAGFDSA